MLSFSKKLLGALLSLLSPAFYFGLLFCGYMTLLAVLATPLWLVEFAINYRKGTLGPVQYSFPANCETGFEAYLEWLFSKRTGLNGQRDTVRLFGVHVSYVG